MEADEACDLILMLPDGSAYIRKVAPARAWNEAKHNTADIIDALWEIAASRAGVPIADAPHITRPAQMLARIEKKKAVKAAKSKIENTKWEEV